MRAARARNHVRFGQLPQTASNLYDGYRADDRGAFVADISAPERTRTLRQPQRSLSDIRVG